MPGTFNGTIKLDVRNSKADWDASPRPFIARVRTLDSLGFFEQQWLTTQLRIGNSRH